MRTPILCLTAALALSCGSCGNYGIHPVSGKVLCDGAPAKGAAVFFYRRGAANPIDEHVIMGIVQDDGSFELVCGPVGKGAPPGEYDVFIEWNRSSKKYKGKGLARQVPDKLNGRYADRQRPLLHATVEGKRNELPPFELTNAGW